MHIRSCRTKSGLSSANVAIEVIHRDGSLSSSPDSGAYDPTNLLAWRSTFRMRPMSSFEEQDDDPELGNGDTVSERLEALDLDEDDTCSTEELRERLDL